MRQAERLLEKDIPLLIHGETGVGKEVFVKALHQASSRSKQAFIAVNCAAIPAELVESELFGYEKGAFTGANQKGSIGLIRKADKGTLFLDEIGDMPLPTQARLLRVLQERCVQPVGSSELFPVDLRIISATNRVLRDWVQAGRFREDLYYRIGGLTLELPPLRERTDKQALFQQLWQQHREPTQWAGLSAEVLALFEQHPWPGNLRQVSSVLQVALAMAEEQPVRPEHLPDDFFVDLNVTAPLPTQPSLEDNSDLSQRLKAAGGNISHLARELGVSRNTLYKRLRQLKADLARFDHHHQVGEVLHPNRQVIGQRRERRRRVVEFEHPGHTQVFQRLGIEAHQAVAVAGQGLQHLTQRLVVDLEQATRPGIRVGAAAGLCRPRVAMIKNRALPGRDLDALARVTLDRHSGLDHRDHGAAVHCALDQITRAQGRGRALIGAYHERPLRVLGHVNPQLALQQFDHALVAVEFHVHRRVAVELQLAAVLKSNLAALADAGALVGRPHRHVLHTEPAAQHYAQHPQGLHPARTLERKGAIQGDACRLRGQRIEATQSERIRSMATAWRGSA